MKATQEKTVITPTVVEGFITQIQNLEEAKEKLTAIISEMAAERRRQLGEKPDKDADAEQRAYELMAQLLDKITNQRNAAYRKINAAVKQLVR